MSGIFYCNRVHEYTPVLSAIQCRNKGMSDCGVTNFSTIAMLKLVSLLFDMPKIGVSNPLVSWKTVGEKDKDYFL